LPSFAGLFMRPLARANLILLRVLLCDISDPFRLRRHPVPSPPKPRSGGIASGAGSREGQNPSIGLDTDAPFVTEVQLFLQERVPRPGGFASVLQNRVSSAARRLPRRAFHGWWSEPPRQPVLALRRTPTCSATLVVISWRMTATIPARCKPTWGIEIFKIRRDTRRSPVGRAPAFEAIVGADVSFAVAQHNVTAQENLLKQLRQQQDYASVIAPFDGVITRRNCSLPAPMPTGMGATARY